MARSNLPLWRSVTAAFDPLRLMRPDEVDRLYQSRQGASQHLQDRFLLCQENTHTRVVLCGARGSGKTTELIYLAKTLEPDYSVMAMDVADLLPDDCNTLTLIALLYLGLQAACLQWQQDDADAPNLKEALKHLPKSGNAALQALAKGLEGTGSLLQITQVLLQYGQWFGVPTAASQVNKLSLEATQLASQKLKNALAERFAGPLDAAARRDADAIIRDVNALAHRLGQLSGRPPLLLLDGLDKLTQLQTIQRAFEDVDLLRAVEASLILTGPIALRHNAHLKGIGDDIPVVLLHNIPVRDHSAPFAPRDAGLQLLRRIYTARCERFGLPTTLVHEDALHAAALACSGFVRQFLDLLHNAARFALRDPQDDGTLHLAHVQAAITERALQLQGFLHEESIRLLRDVLRTGHIPTTPIATDLLFQNLIVCYANGELWYRPHELLVDYITPDPAP